MILEFKIWDKKINGWYVRPENHSLKDLLLLDINGDIIRNTIDYGIVWEKINYPDRYVICQYTGFKDENKNKIFEGDILKIEGIYSSNDYEVRQEDGCWMIYSEKILISEYLYDYYNGKIIGNIFENPEVE